MSSEENKSKTELISRKDKFFLPNLLMLITSLPLVLYLIILNTIYLAYLGFFWWWKNIRHYENFFLTYLLGPVIGGTIIMASFLFSVNRRQKYKKSGFPHEKDIIKRITRRKILETVLLSIGFLTIVVIFIIFMIREYPLSMEGYFH